MKRKDKPRSAPSASAEPYPHYFRHVKLYAAHIGEPDLTVAWRPMALARQAWLQAHGYVDEMGRTDWHRLNADFPPGQPASLAPTEQRNPR